MLDSTGARTLARNILLAAQVREKDEIKKKIEERNSRILKWIYERSFLFWLLCIVLCICYYMVIIGFIDSRATRRDYLDISKYYLHQILTEESPHFNVSLWKCPHGRPGPMAYIAPVRDVYMKHNVNARCTGTKGRCSAIKIAKRVAYDMRKNYAKTIIDDRMPPGPIASEIHPKQEQYCLRSMAEYCESDVHECPFYNDLVEYGKRLVDIPCSHKHLMGPMGPPGKMDIYQCDVYLQRE
jgi:hypothetical protein